MSLTVAMVQSSYIPWKGYFDMLLQADLFVFYDDVQYTKDDWRNRNRIKTKDGPQWLTIPCGAPRDRLICDVRIESDYWQRKHWQAIRHAYAGCDGLEQYTDFFEELYLGRRWESLSELNQTWTRRIATELLGATTQFADSRDYAVDSSLTKDDRWLAMLQEIGATRFLIGPKAKDYLTEEREQEIAGHGIELHWMRYDDYPEYPQRHPPFVHQVSVLDLLFHVGDRAIDYIRPAEAR